MAMINKLPSLVGSVVIAMCLVTGCAAPQEEEGNATEDELRMDEVAKEFRTLEVEATGAIHPQTLGADTWELHAVRMPAQAGKPGFTGILAVGRSEGKPRYALSVDAETREMVLVDEATGEDLATRLKAQGKEFADELTHLHAQYAANNGSSFKTQTALIRPQDRESREAKGGCVAGASILLLSAATVGLVGLFTVVAGGTTAAVGVAAAAGAAAVVGVGSTVAHRLIEDGKVAITKIPADIAKNATVLFNSVKRECQRGFSNARPEDPPVAKTPAVLAAGTDGNWCVPPFLYADKGKPGTGYLVGRCPNGCTSENGAAKCE